MQDIINDAAYVTNQYKFSEDSNLKFKNLWLQLLPMNALLEVEIRDGNIFAGIIKDVEKANGHESCCAQILLHRISMLIQHLDKSKIISFFLSLADGIHFPDEINKMIDNQEVIMLYCCDYLTSNRPLILVPDPYMLCDSKRLYCHQSSQFNLPFHERKNLAVFRGAQTGGGFCMQSVKEMKIPRLIGMHKMLERPDLLDIRMNSYTCQSDDAEYAEYMTKTFGPPGTFQHVTETATNKYFLSFDGNYVAFSRPEIAMASGSVPLIQTRYKKYWSRFLVDGVNYMHIKDDLSNLIEVVEFLNCNPEKAEEIAKNARETYIKYIRPEFADALLVNVLNLIGQ